MRRPICSNGTAERYNTEVPPTSLQAVDLVVILVGLFGHALARFGDQCVAVAVLGGAHRAGFGAGGQLALRSAARSTCRTCASCGRRLVPFVGRHLERAGLHAVAAAHALVGVVNHRARARFSATRPPGRPKRRPAAAQFMHSRRLNVAVRLDGGQLVGGDASLRRQSCRCRGGPNARRTLLRKPCTRCRGCCRTGSPLTYIGPSTPF